MAENKITKSIVALLNTYPALADQSGLENPKKILAKALENFWLPRIKLRRQTFSQENKWPYKNDSKASIL